MRADTATHGTASTCSAPQMASFDELASALAHERFLMLVSSARPTGEVAAISGSTPVGTVVMDADVLAIAAVELIGDAAFMPDRVLLPRRLSAVDTDSAGNTFEAQGAAESPEMDSLRTTPGRPTALLVARYGSDAIVSEVHERDARNLRLAGDVIVDVDELAASARRLRADGGGR